MERKDRIMNRIGTVLLGAFMLTLTGCSSMKFLASGKEFRKICEDNGLRVQDTEETVKTTGGYKNLSDAYIATTEDGLVSVCYVRFTDQKEAQSYYDSVADQMDGSEYTGPNYQAEVEVVEDTCREIYMESGRIIYAEGDASTIGAIEKQLIGTWTQDPVKKTVAPAK